MSASESRVASNPAQAHSPGSENVQPNNRRSLVSKKKALVLSLSRSAKLEKLAPHSPCRSNGCECLGWKIPSPLVPSISSKAQTNLQIWPDTLCERCQHKLSSHVFHLQNLPVEALNFFWGIAVDRDYLQSCHQNEQDAETKEVYRILHKLLGQSIHNLTTPDISQLGTPPFEDPTITMALLNFLSNKFGHLPEKSKAMREVSNIFLFCVKYLKLPTPSAKRQSDPNEDMTKYQLSYKRWLCFCRLPAFVDSLPHYDVPSTFGKTFLRSAFPVMKKMFLEKFKDIDKLPKEKKKILLDNYAEFLLLLEEEVYKDNSPMWYSDSKNQSASSDGMKRNSLESYNCPEQKMQKLNGDIPQEVVVEILKTVTDPRKMVGPETDTTHISNCEIAQRQKKEGLIKFYITGNSLTKRVSEQSLKWLINALNLFSAQLPYMPKSYITRLIFDPKHKTLVLLLKEEVIGGICFRMFRNQGFSEIAFLAVSDVERNKGYATHMMNHLKDYHIKHGIYHLVAYADNFALPYFRKQGFTTDIRLPSSVYSGCIKECDGAVLMGCQLNPKVVYTALSDVLQCQKEVVRRLIEKNQSQVKVSYPGLEAFKNGVRAIPVEEIPGIMEAGWRREERQRQDGIDSEKLNQTLESVLQSVREQTCAWPFRKPVDKNEAPNYYDYVKYPMDLHTMSERLKNGYYCNTRLFICDMKRIFNNCRAYNGPETEVYRCACLLENYFNSEMGKYGYNVV